MIFFELKNYKRWQQREFIEMRLEEVKRDLTSSENKLKEFRERNRQVFAPHYF